MWPEFFAALSRPLVRRTGVALGVFVLSGCASTDRLERQMSALRTELQTVRTEVSDTRRQVERLESRVTLLSLGGSAPKTPVASRGYTAPANKPVTTKGPGRVLPVVRLSNKTDPDRAANPQQVDAPGALDDGSPPILIQLGPSGGEKLSVDRSVLKKHDPVLHAPRASRTDVRTAYQAALTELREKQRPEAALQRFEAFLKDHGDSHLADNALYWSGECLYSLGRFDDSVGAFKRVLAEHPRSAKVPHTMLRLAEVDLARGKTKRGRRMLRRLIRKHPSSAAAKTARTKLKEAGS